MRVRVSRLCWGLVLVMLGVVALLVNVGYLPRAVWSYLVALWPVVLIAVGLRLAFRGTRWVYLGPLVVVLAVAFALARAIWDRPTWRLREAPEVWRFDQPVRPGTVRVRIELDLSAVRLEVSGGASGIVEGVVSGWSGQPRVAYEGEAGGTAGVRVSQGSTGTWWPGFGWGEPRGRWRGWPLLRDAGPERWDLRLTQSMPVSLALEGGALDARLDLSNVTLAELDLDVGASTVEIHLGDRGVATTATLDAGASRVTLRVPRSLGLSISVSGGLASTNLSELGLDRRGDNWVSRNWESAKGRLTMRVSAGVTRFVVVYSESGSV